jgi:hypothetical protein
MREQKMKSLWSTIKWLLAVGVLLFALLIFKIHFTLTAKPKITVDYVAEYNRITRPQNYDPNDNAAPYYQKAFDAFVEMPQELRNPYINWPADFNGAEHTLLENWLASNSQAFEYFKIAADKPYYWLERHTDKDNNMMSILLPELSPLKCLSEALLWSAKQNASQEKYQDAFVDILACWRAGCQKCGIPFFLVEQSVGMSRKKAAVDNALLILDKTQADSSALKSFQDALQTEFDNDAYVPAFTAEKLSLYDALQMTFIDNGRGTGRLAWRVAWYYDTLGGVWANRSHRLNCFFGPTRNQTVKQIEKVFTLSNQVMTQTPWQLKSEGCDYFEEIEKINNSNFLLQLLGINPKIIFHIYHKTRAQMEALLAVLAILRFKADNHRLPVSLDELASAGYLQSVPMDPYSDGPLVYKPDKGNFKLYSVGEDFSDDGGSNEFKKETRKTRSAFDAPAPDIVYWPVRKLKDPRKELSAEQMEKLRVAKEADVFGATQDSDHSNLNK